jgi:hypothetical protein
MARKRMKETNMADEPEKIWAKTNFDYYELGLYGDWYGDGVQGGTEYTRTDISQARYNKLEREAVNLTETQIQWEARIAKLEAALLWISLGPGYTETPSEAVLEMMRVSSEAMKEQT